MVDEGLVETRRGRGMFINAGARSLLMKGERQKFLSEEWPRIQEMIRRLGLSAEELLDGSANGKPSQVSSKDAPPNSNDKDQEER